MSILVMCMRFLLAVPLAFAATPALAHDRAPPPMPSGGQVAAALSDPLVQETVAAVVGQVAGAVLDTHVGPMAHYTDPRDDIRPDTTLRDLAHRSNPSFERRLHDNTVGAVALAGRGAKDAIAMSAELNATAQRLRHVLDQAAQSVDQVRRN